MQNIEKKELWGASTYQKNIPEKSQEVKHAKQKHRPSKTWTTAAKSTT